MTTKTHCERGHEFTPENTVRRRDGTRACRTCKNAGSAASKREQNPGMYRIDKLRAAGVIVPIIRQRRGDARRITTVSRDGAVKKQTTLTEIQGAMVRRADIEFGDNKAVRPEAIPCRFCGSKLPVARTGRVPQTCPSGCRLGCGHVVHRNRVQQALRAGEPPRCLRCSPKCPDCRLGRCVRHERSRAALGCAP